MPRYSEERKRAVLAKLLPPDELRPKTVADQEGIALARIYNWRRRARAQGCLMPNADASGPERWSARDKFAAVVETAAMSEHERGEYCRRRGLYREQLERWRGDCERAADLAAGERHERAGQARSERRRVRELERELRRKEAALAETAALLALQKKRRRSGCHRSFKNTQQLGKLGWPLTVPRAVHAPGDRPRRDCLRRHGTGGPPDRLALDEFGIQPRLQALGNGHQRHAAVDLEHHAPGRAR